jgi:hypothetical protein
MVHRNYAPVALRPNRCPSPGPNALPRATGTAGCACHVPAMPRCLLYFSAADLKVHEDRARGRRAVRKQLAQDEALQHAETQPYTRLQPVATGTFVRYDTTWHGTPCCKTVKQVSNRVASCNTVQHVATQCRSRTGAGTPGMYAWHAHLAYIVATHTQRYTCHIACQCHSTPAASRRTPSRRRRRRASCCLALSTRSSSGRCCAGARRSSLCAATR